MSRGDGRALEAAAEALEREIAPTNLDTEQAARRIVFAYLDALLSELPEEAVDAMEDAYLESDCPHDAAEEFRIAARAFLRSLRSSSRGPADGE